MQTTESQSKAIESKNSKILVSAGAGSGKTFVLSSRVVNLVESGIPLDSIVVLTFTKAAAAEMKERIKTKLQESKNEFAQAQAENVDVAPICTLHAFASKVLRQYFFEIGIDPAFSVLDDTQAMSLKTQAIETVMRNETQKKSDEFFDLVDVLFQNRKDENFKRSIFALHDFLSSLPNPDEYLALAKDLYSSEKSAAKAIQFMTNEVASRAHFFLRKVELLTEECKKEELKKLIDVLSELELNLLRIRPLNTVAQMKMAADEFSAPTKITQKTNPELAEQVSELKTQVKKFFDSVGEMYAEPQNYEISNEKANGRINALINICGMFQKEYAKLKENDGSLDFADLERYLYNFLQLNGSSALKETIEYLFVDEYQDTNRLQQAIYENFNAKNYFYVGDLKQSIYGFRLAEPKIFDETRTNFRNKDGEVITLAENFRSHQELIDFTNRLFGKIMTADLGGEDYITEGAMKRGGDNFPRIGEGSAFGNYSAASFPRVKIVSIKKAKFAAQENEQLPLYSVANHKNSTDEKIDSPLAEGRALAKMLSALADARIYDSKQGRERAVESSDIAILSASRGEYLKSLLAAAEEQGYSFSPDISQNILEDADLNELLCLLRLISNPKQDIPLFVGLSGYFGGLSSNELAQIKLANPNENNFFISVEKFVANKEINKSLTKLQQKVKKFYSFIDGLRFFAQSSTVTELISHIISITDFDVLLLSKKDGEQKMSLLDSLKEQLSNLSCNNNLDDFLWTADNVGFFATETIAANRGVAVYNKDGEAIRTFQNITVTTIHKSKGLEFPIVILVGAGRTFNRDDLSKDIVLSKRFGIGITNFDSFERVKTSNVIKNAIKLDLQKQALEEDIRLLYVAVTRAINNLIIIGVGDPTDPATIEKNILSSNCFFDLISKLFSDRFPPLYISTQKESFEVLAEQINKVPIAVPVFPKNEELINQFTSAFTSNYDHAESTRIAQKYSVSELSKSQDFIPLNDFTNSESENGSTELGNAYHHIMQHINFKTKTQDELNFEKLRTISSGLVSQRDWELVDEGKLLNCFNSPLFIVLGRSTRQVLREQQFLMSVPAKEINISKDCSDNVLVQGVFDMVIFDRDSVLIVDYKTGGAKTEQQLKEKYKRQMELYKKAAENAFGKPVFVAIYSFAMEKLVRIN